MLRKGRDQFRTPAPILSRERINNSSSAVSCDLRFSNKWATRLSERGESASSVAGTIMPIQSGLISSLMLTKVLAGEQVSAVKTK